MNTYVKKSLDEFLEYRKGNKKNKDKEVISFDQWKEWLFEYCDENKKMPTYDTLYEDHKYGHWIDRQRRKIKDNMSDTYIALSDNGIDKKLMISKRENRKRK